MNGAVHRLGYFGSPAQSQPLFELAVGSTWESDVVAVGPVTLLDLAQSLEQVDHPRADYAGTDGHQWNDRSLRGDRRSRTAGMTGRSFGQIYRLEGFRTRLGPARIDRHRSPVSDGLR